MKLILNPNPFSENENLVKKQVDITNAFIVMVTSLVTKLDLRMAIWNAKSLSS